MEENKLQYGSFTLRFFAYLFDWLLIQLIPLILIFFTVSFATTTGEIWLGLLWIFWEIFFLQYLLVNSYQILTFIYFGASLGKLLAGLEIIKEDGSRPTIYDALLRFPIGYAVSSILWGLGFFWIIKDAKKKGFHDYIAQTVVVKKHSATALFFGIVLLFILTIFLLYEIYIIGVSRQIWAGIYADWQAFWQWFPSK